MTLDSSDTIVSSAKLTNRDLYNSIGQPKTIVAPMVDQSELAWRILSRRYGADLCYTPMFHSRLFANDLKYRNNMWCKLDGDAKSDRPLVVQFCANDPEHLLNAAKLVENQCDAVDLNLGCPQGIAKKGNYGAFLMDDWPLVHKLIKNLHENLNCPVTAKIRVYDDWNKSLEYAKMVLDAGAQFITIHGRTRDMKGQATGLANWELLRFLRDNLPKDQVFFANGNILYPEDIERCSKAVECDAVMSAEGNLYNPGVFWTATDDIEKQFCRVDKMLREYFEIVKEVSSESLASRHAMKSHFFKLLHAFLNVHRELRPDIGKLSVHAPMDDWEKIVIKVEDIVNDIYKKDNISDIDIITTGDIESWGGRYKTVPYWRCQPYFRTVNGEKQNLRTLHVAATEKKQETKENEKKAEVIEKADTKRKAEEELEKGSNKKSLN
ncbi:tRNA-dihydrouridine(16/17) synthase [NAD(P)(+)] [[Candida] railenensis]|uniref:tRNA-dihydrouridine(16/17) synthase [NAD(P)(+)] n=1 Tax=[Candida] railenensis TaxID=45579 RepID=A0A9P0QPZ3_9ASCO|nr:tRNA-dihydrouridine(16/17) synthase [NAD(P)(+)] [[Candida] railenensis]